MNRSLFIIFFIVFLISFNGFGQTTVTCPVSADCMIFEYSANSNHNTSSLWIGFDSDYEQRSLIQFDLSSIPSGAIIQDAEMKLTYATTQENISFNIYRLTSSWSENTITWNSTYSYYSTSYGSQTAWHFNPEVYVPLDAVVTDWIENGYDNYGVLLKWKLGSGNCNFESKESASTSGEEPSLEVTYTISPPDITVQNPSVTPTTVCPGGTINVSCDHYCSGGSDETPNVGYYLSTNTTCSTSNTYLGDDGSSICGSDLYDGESESVIIPPETSPGTYYICFIGDYLDEVSESDESNNCEYIQITVNSPPPTVQFSASSTYIEEGDSIDFSDQSTNNPTNWSWTFSGGNPSSSTSQNPNNICYTTAGSYEVSLTATNSCGSNTETKTSYINVNQTSQLPVADFTVTSTNIYEGDSIDFIDQSTNNPTNWSWTFSGGNPSSSTLQNPSNICYSTEGIYQVSLTVTNSEGSDTETKTSYITVIKEPLPPVADFTVSSTSICESNCVNFTDLTANSPTNWSWTFSGGNPNSSTSQNPSNICYSLAGTYQVSLIVTNSEGSDTLTRTSYITVGSPPIVTISGENKVCPMTSEIYTASNNNDCSYQWSVEGGSISSGQNTSQINVKWGDIPPLTISLIETINSTGCSNNADYSVTFNPLPEINIIGDTSVCPNDYKIYNTDYNNDHSYQWIAEGGSIITGQNTNEINVAWADSSEGSVYLQGIVDSTGCISDTTVQITINPLPVIQSIFGESTACTNTSLTYGVADIENSFLWQASGGEIGNDTINMVNILWEQAGEQEVRLTETNSFGCAVESILSVNVADGELLDNPEIKLKFGALLIGTNLLDAFASYQWYNEEGAISGATGQFYELPLPLSGEYYLIATDNNNCKAESNHLVFDGSESYSSILAYPNPVSEELSILFPERDNGSLNIQLFNNTGQAVIINSIKNGNYLEKINTADLMEGMYFLIIESKGEVIYSEKIIVQH